MEEEVLNSHLNLKINPHALFFKKIILYTILVASRSQLSWLWLDFFRACLDIPMGLSSKSHRIHGLGCPFMHGSINQTLPSPNLVGREKKTSMDLFYFSCSPNSRIWAGPWKIWVRCTNMPNFCMIFSLILLEYPNKPIKGNKLILNNLLNMDIFDSH